METVLEECTTEEQRSVVHFCGQKDSIQRIFVKTRFLFTVGSVCYVKIFTTVSKNVTNVSLMTKSLNGGVKVAETTVKNFYAAGFEALVKRWDKCINVGGGYVEK
jgi:hypothetical protein